MDIDSNLASEAIREALNKYPDMVAYGPRLIWRALFQGGAFMLEYEKPPEIKHPDAWEFQNAVVKGYKRLAGV